jgi:hypothetical protein
MPSRINLQSQPWLLLGNILATAIVFFKSSHIIAYLISNFSIEKFLLDFRKLFHFRFPFVNIKSNLVDAHLYIIKKWVVDFLVSNK